ncbi:vitamin B12 ABC transporter substrate-binding protein BtuF [Pectobacterium aroidearum]|uniref:vitamin B12 ABC transporter substrate-binding protein BtuF n=1 Tax=Pectobacterium aroidearum TaxID=1201031 RepID=UPI0021156C6E|nr:vitamin B12 ABC transporter substrate-binding protein BtuF [Pectobacterium aroidearum]UUE46137.1 vitamin B12 ABC transporter substrate-binding protein BtuF [Pectobacterium aroidearum]UUE50357.1 vitamin B12 ABC transporter substrate-binding protein BtuF [Pectobacterium aroidearum]UUE54562.1 vitamin B12 ABC transporter substrate-binding protein BtuF [Pectobacterium aroidearum]UUE62971.1 vitamin B12 ABC transporter substrate-binding protein BtuF [Pectobacterium aroidearum]UUE67194.1 vitamin B1
MAVRFLCWLTGLLLCTAAYALPQRVISLAPHATEMAYAAGMGEQLIAVSAWSDYPPEAKKLEQVASWQGINLERILALKPDLILAWREGNPQRPLEQLANFSIPIVYLDAKTLDDIPASLRQLATYSRHPEQAERAATDFQQEIGRLRHTGEGQNAASLRVFIQFGTQPLFTSSQATLQSQIVSLCGAENIFSDSPVPWPQVSREQVLRRQPQAIIIGGSPDKIASVQAFWQPQLAVPVITVDEDWFSRSGPRLLLAAQQICSQLTALSPGSSSAK